MEIKGHKMYKIGDSWMFDITAFVGYKVKRVYRKPTLFEEAFKVAVNNEEIQFIKLIEVPLGVLRKVKNKIESYSKEAYIK